MSYLKDLDEYTTKELEAELARRRDAAGKGLCDYCLRPRTTAPCRFPERHAGRDDGPYSVSVNGRVVRIESRYLSYERLVAIAGLGGQPSMTGRFPKPPHRDFIVKPGEYVSVRDGLRIDVCHTGAA